MSTTEADKLDAEVAKLRAQTAVALAESRAKSLETRKAEREELESATPAAVKQRAAEAEKAAAQASKDAAQLNKDAAGVRQQQFASYIPDFSKLDRGTLTQSGDGALLGSAFAQLALEDAATAVVTALDSQLQNVKDWKLLVTSDENLADADAAYGDVDQALEQMQKAADQALKEPAPRYRRGFVPELGAAVAAAIPPLLSLFSARRTVTTATATVTDLAAAAATASALKDRDDGGTVVHDTFRLVPDGPIQKRVTALTKSRLDLTKRGFAVAAERDAATLEQARITKTIATYTEQRGKTGTDDAALERAIEAEEAKLSEQSAVLAAHQTEHDVVASTGEAIDKFLEALHTVPTGGVRSPLSAAALHQQFRMSMDKGGFTHILLIRSQNGSVQSLTDDKPLWWNDKFSVIATLTVTYMLLNLPAGDLAAVGNAHGVAEGKGLIGSKFDVEGWPPPQSA